jgi:hypothetical protein
MKILIACTLFFAATLSWGQVITNNLVLYLDANIDTSGADGWDFTQPAVSGGGGTLPVVNNAPTNLVEAKGGRYFRATGTSQGFGGTVPDAPVYSYSWEVWLRLNAPCYACIDDAIASWRHEDPGGGSFPNGFTRNWCSIFVGAADRRELDINIKDFDGTRTDFSDQIVLGFGDWHQMVITYQDASDAITGDGVLSFYLNGDTNPVHVVSDLEQHNRGFQAEPDHSVMNYASTWFIAQGEANRNMNGDLAILRLYDVVLTPEQIVQNWDAQKALYPFPEPPSTIVPVNQTDLVEVQVDTVNGTIYELQRTTSPLADDNWQSAEVFIKGSGSAMRMYDNRDPGGPAYNRVSVSVP